jgi:hypothetical protein
MGDSRSFAARNMGLVDEPALERLVAAGCPACGARKLVFLTIVDGSLPLMGGEPVDRITWIYDGEKFVDGVYRVSCADCKQLVFEADVCPRCHAPGGLQPALHTANRWPVPPACPECGEEQVKYLALLPARVVYEGARADKARSLAEPHDDGFHGYRVDCRDCGTVAQLLDSCPLCAAPAPLRARPG